MPEIPELSDEGPEYEGPDVSDLEYDEGPDDDEPDISNFEVPVVTDAVVTDAPIVPKDIIAVREFDDVLDPLDVAIPNAVGLNVQTSWYNVFSWFQ